MHLAITAVLQFLVFFVPRQKKGEPSPPLFDSPFDSHEWPTQNFSLQYKHRIKQTSWENKEEN